MFTLHGLLACHKQTDVPILEGDRSHKKSKKRRKTAGRSPETTETHTLNKKGTALCSLSVRSYSYCSASCALDGAIVKRGIHRQE